MSNRTLLECPALGPVLVSAEDRCDILLADQARIPGWVRDLATFRQWIHSDDFPERGLFAYLRDLIWVDLSQEEFFTHNRVKLAFIGAFGKFCHDTNLGEYIAPHVRWTNLSAGVSTEPDGMFYTWEATRCGRMRYVKGAHGGITELEGSPDMTLEILSATSVTKDTVYLRDLYWRAGVTEYWLVDARGETPRFEILRHTPTGFVAVEPQEGWQPSAVFGHEFQLTREADPMGNPLYELRTREGEPAA